MMSPPSVWSAVTCQLKFSKSYNVISSEKIPPSNVILPC